MSKILTESGWAGTKQNKQSYVFIFNKPEGSQITLSYRGPNGLVEFYEAHHAAVEEVYCSLADVYVTITGAASVRIS